jgi:hypothetical protein
MQDLLVGGVTSTSWWASGRIELAAVRRVSSPAATAPSWLTWPRVNARNVPSVGARTSLNSRPIPPWRSRSTSVIEREDFRSGVRPALRGQREPPGQQRRKPAPMRQRHRRHQPGHTTRSSIVEPHADRAVRVR